MISAGGVAERTKAGDLKSLEGSQPSVGSNPTPSAKASYYNYSISDKKITTQLVHKNEKVLSINVKKKGFKW